MRDRRPTLAACGNGAGCAHASLFAMCALTRGQWWEITAMAEIVRQARDIAESLAIARAKLGRQPLLIDRD